MCGDWTSLKCNPKRWFHYMGDKEINGYVPFQINYILHNTSDEDSFLSPPVVPCYKHISVSVILHLTIIYTIKLYIYMV